MLPLEHLEVAAAEAIAPVVCTQLAALGSSLRALKLHASHTTQHRGWKTSSSSR